MRGDSARYRGEPRRDALLVARFGAGEQALVLVAMASGARATPGAHRAAAEVCRWIGRAVGRSHARLAEDLRAARRGDLKSGLHRLTDRSLGRLRAAPPNRAWPPTSTRRRCAACCCPPTPSAGRGSSSGSAPADCSGCGTAPGRTWNRASATSPAGPSSATADCRPAHPGPAPATRRTDRPRTTGSPWTSASPRPRARTTDRPPSGPANPSASGPR
ncbi:protein phosphatase 2C domain-containing protein [Streptomyces sp. NBUA17]|uniref:protein phosphatase 2C domain-containing protein n=1 Tax=Streptomyces sp. NBUA17 TaxID=3062275 RepID=UPI0037D9D433